MSFADIIERIPGKSDGDQALLAKIFEKFPGVSERFDSFANLPAARRIPKAIGDMEQIPRTGWLRLEPELNFKKVLVDFAQTTQTRRSLMFEESPGCESIASHLIECEELYIRLFSHKPHVVLGREVAKFHDIGEPAFRDFTPYEDISPDEKKRLEWLAVNLLTESRHSGNLHAFHVYNCFLIFERDIHEFEPLGTAMMREIRQQRQSGLVKPFQEQFVRILEQIYSTPVSDDQLKELQVRTKDIDRLQMAYQAHRIWIDERYGVSKEQARTMLDDFWNYVAERLETAEARQNFIDLRRIDARAA